MSRPGYRAAVAPATPPDREKTKTRRPAAPHAIGRAEKHDSGYVERALLLWPRIDRSRLRRCGDDPGRIAEFVRRRTSQPLEAILAMLTRQSPAPLAPTEVSSGFETGKAESARLAMHIVRGDDEADLAALTLA